MAGRVLVTGAGGFLGSHFCSYFGSHGYEVAAVGRFSARSVDTELYPNLWQLCGMTLPDHNLVAVFRDFRPTLVIHAAGTASVADSVQAPYSDFQRTVDVCAFTLELTRQYASQAHFVLLSSASVYGNPHSLPIDEEAQCKPLSPYGYHKWLCELLANEYSSLQGVKVSVLRIFSAYGERMKRQVMFDLCKKFLDPEQPEVRVQGTGSETRDFIHALDVARIIELLAAKDACGTFNVASGSQTTVKELVELLSSCLGYRKKVSYDGQVRPGDPMHWHANIEKIRDLGFVPEVILPAGVAAFCNWFKEYYGRKWQK